MREIKFEAIYQPTGEHFVPHEIDFKNGTLTGDWDNEVMQWCNFSLDGKSGDAILRQYTGLKDKNETEIYEGDIVEQTYHVAHGNPYEGTEGSYDGHHTGEVVITSRGVCMRNPLHYSMDNDETKLVKTYKQLAGYRTKVIGNIWEHPHLLEGRESIPKEDTKDGS